jgi:hypothetical protein
MTPPNPIDYALGRMRWRRMIGAGFRLNLAAFCAKRGGACPWCSID